MNKIFILLILTSIFTLRIYAHDLTDMPGPHLSFEEYLSKVRKSNLGYLAVQMNVDIAEAEAVSMSVFPDPAFDFEIGRDYYSFGISYLLETGKRRSRIRLANSVAEYENLALQYYFQELRAMAANAYLDVMLQKELLNLSISSYEYMLQLSISDSLRYCLGEIMENDARQSKFEAEMLLTEVYTLQAEYDNALVILNEYMGEELTYYTVPELRGNDWEYSLCLDDLIETGMENRIDIAAAEKEIEINTNQYKLAKPERRPDIGLSVAYDRDRQNRNMPVSGGIVGGISIPLKFSNVNKGTLKAAESRIRQSDIRKKEIVLQARSEIAQSWNIYESERRKLELFENGMLEESRKILEGVILMYKKGGSAILDVLIAQRSYNDINSRYFETMRNYAISLVQLEKACGIWNMKTE